MISDMTEELQKANIKADELNRGNAALKIKCQGLEIKNEGLRKQMEGQSVVIGEISAERDEKER